MQHMVWLLVCGACGRNFRALASCQLPRNIWGLDLGVSVTVLIYCTYNQLFKNRWIYTGSCRTTNLYNMTIRRCGYVDSNCYYFLCIWVLRRNANKERKSGDEFWILFTFLPCNPIVPGTCCAIELRICALPL